MEMHDTIKRLEGMLRAYDNPSPPPSKKSSSSKTKKRGGGTGKKRDGQDGHPGTTSKPKPTGSRITRWKNSSATAGSERPAAGYGTLRTGR